MFVGARTSSANFAVAAIMLVLGQSGVLSAADPMWVTQQQPTYYQPAPTKQQPAAPYYQDPNGQYYRDNDGQYVPPAGYQQQPQQAQPNKAQANPMAPQRQPSRQPADKRKPGYSNPTVIAPIDSGADDYLLFMPD